MSCRQLPAPTTSEERPKQKEEQKPVRTKLTTREENESLWVNEKEIDTEKERKKLSSQIEKANLIFFFLFLLTI
jgi:hypothetical protein